MLWVLSKKMPSIIATLNGPIAKVTSSKRMFTFHVDDIIPMLLAKVLMVKPMLNRRPAELDAVFWTRYPLQ